VITAYDGQEQVDLVVEIEIPGSWSTAHVMQMRIVKCMPNAGFEPALLLKCGPEACILFALAFQCSQLPLH
jgi:hypothetical protein